MSRITRTIVCFCALALLVSIALPVRASAEDNPFKWGFIERLRNTYFDNIIDYNADNDDKQDFFRIRTSLWGQYAGSPNTLLYCKLTNEWRYYAAHPAKAAKNDYPNDFHEVFVDNLYAKITGGDETKMALTLGRQNIIFGEGFVMLDGTPLDGSRSIYHNGARLTVTSGTTTIDVFGVSNPHKDKLVLINDMEQGLANLYEQGFGAYLTSKANPKMKLEGYFIHKREDPGDSGSTLSLNTVGARASRPMVDNVAFASEFAYQFGSRGSVNQKSFGGYAYLSYLLMPESKTAVTGGAYYLSGDDPSSADYEGWNPLFARWPKWSELYIYSHIAEMGILNRQPLVAYPTNTFSPYVKLSTDLSKTLNLEGPKSLSFTATYYYVRANHERALAGGMSGKMRGQEIQALFKFRINKHLSGHFLFDHFFPGNFYSSKDGGTFIRGDLTFSM